MPPGAPAAVDLAAAAAAAPSHPGQGRPIQDEDLLISVSGGLGRYDEEANVYRKDADCLECLKDLQRFLRRDDQYHREVFHRLGQWDLVSTDIVPLIVHYQDDQDVVYNALKILTFLTMPIDPTSDHLHVQCRYLKRIKDCFLANDAVAVIVGLLSRPLSRYPRLSERDILVVQLVLTFIRNLLCVDDAPRDLGIDNPVAEDASGGETKGDLLIRLSRDNVLDLILLVAQHCNEKTFKNDSALILQIIHQVFDGFAPLQLFDKSLDAASNSRSKAPGAPGAGKPQSSGERKHLQHKTDLRNALLSEKRTRVTSRSQMPMRHRNISGTFVKKYKDVKQQTIFTPRSNKPGIERDEQMYKSSGKRGRALPERQIYPMTRALRDVLRSFADSLLEGGYDILMDSIRPELMHGIGISRLEKEDYIRFFRLSCFCTSYKKLVMQKMGERELREKYQVPGKSPFSEISATMGWDMFHLLLTVWQQQIEIPSRAEEKDWDLQASSLGLLKEMMYVLDLAHQIGTKADRKAADKLQRRLLHDDLRQSGLFPLLCRMIKNYNMRIQPMCQAGDMMEALYIIIHTFERLDRTERGGFIVRQRASRRVAQTKQAKTPEENQESKGGEEGKDPDQPKEGAKDDSNGDNGSQGAKQGPALGEGAPDKAQASGEKTEKEPQAAAAVAVAGDKEEGGSPQRQQSKSLAPLEELENESETDSDGRMALKESTFDLNHRLSQELAAPLLITTLTFALENYKSNSKQLNTSVVGILKRIVLPDCLNLMPCVWHISFLLVCEKILSDGSIREMSDFSSMIQVCKYITRKLLDRLQPELTDDMDAFQRTAKESLARITFVDLLFWKNRKDAEMVRDEYGWQNKYAHREAIRKALADEDEACGAGILKSIDKLAPVSSSKAAFTEDDHEMLREAYAKHKDAEGEAAAAIVDAIVEEMNFKFKPRRVRMELKALGLALKAKRSAQESKLTEEERKRLAEVWAEHKDKSKGRMKAIAEAFDLKYTTRRLGTELRLLGLMESPGPKAKGKRITENQLQQIKAAFEKHQNNPSFLDEVVTELVTELEGEVTPAQVKRALKKLGLERRKITKLADSSDSSDSSDDSDAGADRTKSAQAKASPWEVGGESDEEESGSSSDDEDDDDDDDDDGGVEEEEEEEEEALASEGGGAGATERLEEERQTEKSASPSPKAKPEKRKPSEKDDEENEEEVLEGSRRSKKSKTLRSSLQELVSSQSQRSTKKQRLVKKALSQPETKPTQLFEDEDEDDVQVTPATDKRKGNKITLLDSDSE